MKKIYSWIAFLLLLSTNLLPMWGYSRDMQPEGDDSYPQSVADIASN